MFSSHSFPVKDEAGCDETLRHSPFLHSLSFFFFRSQAFLSLQILFQTLLLSFLLPLIVFTPLSYPLSYLLPKQLVESGKISSGPFGLIFSILFQYARLVPDTWSIRIGSNFWLGERWTVWILALLVSDLYFSIILLVSSLLYELIPVLFSRSDFQLFFSHPKETILPSLLGIVFSKLYSSNSTFFSFLRKFRLPQVIYSTLSYLLLPLIGSTKLPSRTNFAEFPRNPTFEERRERIQGERTALERERERGGRYGLNFIRRRGSRNQEPTIPVTVTITDETQDQEAGIQSGNGNVNGTLPANARRSRRSTMFTSRGRNWVIVPPPPEGTEQGPSVEDTSRNRNDASENRSTSPNQIRAFRNYLNQSEFQSAPLSLALVSPITQRELVRAEFGLLARNSKTQLY